MTQPIFTISDVATEANSTYYRVHYLIRSGKFKERLEKKGGQYMLTTKQKDKMVVMLNEKRG